MTCSVWHYGRTQAELKRLNQSLEREVEARTRDLQTMVDKLQAFSYQDALTSLHNRRYFDELFGLADKALYAAKHQGRARVEVYAWSHRGLRSSPPPLR